MKEIKDMAEGLLNECHRKDYFFQRCVDGKKVCRLHFTEDIMKFCPYANLNDTYFFNSHHYLLCNAKKEKEND